MLLLVIAVVVVTVYISLLKPMRMAGKISPIEAIRYQESSKNKKLRTGNISVNVFRLAKANLLRNKKRTIVTMVTMGLSCVLFMSMAGILNSMRADDIADRQLEGSDFKIEMDYDVNDETYPRLWTDGSRSRRRSLPRFLRSRRRRLKYLHRRPALFATASFPLYPVNQIV